MYVSQFVLTETNQEIAKNVFSSLKKWERNELKNGPLQDWLKHQFTGDDVNGLNVVISDFVNEKTVRDVVRCNFRILP